MKGRQGSALRFTITICNTRKPRKPSDTTTQDTTHILRARLDRLPFPARLAQVGPKSAALVMCVRRHFRQPPGADFQHHQCRPGHPAHDMDAGQARDQSKSTRSRMWPGPMRWSHQGPLSSRSVRGRAWREPSDMSSCAGASWPSTEDRPSLYSHFMTSAMLLSVPSEMTPFFVAAQVGQQSAGEGLLRLKGCSCRICASNDTAVAVCLRGQVLPHTVSHGLT